MYKQHNFNIVYEYVTFAKQSKFKLFRTCKQFKNDVIRLNIYEQIFKGRSFEETPDESRHLFDLNSTRKKFSHRKFNIINQFAPSALMMFRKFNKSPLSGFSQTQHHLYIRAHNMPSTRIFEILHYLPICTLNLSWKQEQAILKKSPHSNPSRRFLYSKHSTIFFSTFLLNDIPLQFSPFRVYAFIVLQTHDSFLFYTSLILSPCNTRSSVQILQAYR